MLKKEEIKEEIYKISAKTDRGQRLNKLVAPVYQENLKEIKFLTKELIQFSDEIKEDKLNGEWELIFSDVELFRSSPFFLAIEKALDNKNRSDLFFKLHQLQVCSFGLSTIGKITQKINFDNKEFISTFDTTIFGLTTIPIFGWFKLLPTFGGRVITFADDLSLNKNILKMTLQKTKVSEVEGLKRIPLFSSLLMDRWYQVNTIWEKLPWNINQPSFEIFIKYIDEDMRIMEDMYGSIFVYMRKKIMNFEK
tara:strand:- start:120 stop:872 length:753 start_codon:yes stop_codon:yes gene_type:complete